MLWRYYCYERGQKKKLGTHFIKYNKTALGLQLKNIVDVACNKQSVVGVLTFIGFTGLYL